jgi:hypothetical protein
VDTHAACTVALLDHYLQAKLEAAKAALLECQLPKYAHTPTLVGLQRAEGEVGNVKVIFDEDENDNWSLDDSVWPLLTYHYLTLSSRTTT